MRRDVSCDVVFVTFLLTIDGLSPSPALLVHAIAGFIIVVSSLSAPPLDCCVGYFLRPPIKYSEDFQNISGRIFGAGR